MIYNEIVKRKLEIIYKLMAFLTVLIAALIILLYARLGDRSDLLEVTADPLIDVENRPIANPPKTSASSSVEIIKLVNISNISADIKEPAVKKTMFRDDFDGSETLEEAVSASRSDSQDWWLNSGAMLYEQDGVGKTIYGELPLGSKWQIHYSRSNPQDTDNGLHPQNIFRLLTKTKWTNSSQRLYFTIDDDNKSLSPHRDASNGVLLMIRYKDEDNLYYAGLRVDGNVVIKKKIDGEYYTMGNKKVFFGQKYDKNENPNLLPKNKVIGIRADASNSENGKVIIAVYIDETESDNWTEVLSVTDDENEFGGKAFVDSGNGGIRSDFMDVRFDHYAIWEIGS